MFSLYYGKNKNRQQDGNRNVERRIHKNTFGKRKKIIFNRQNTSGHDISARKKCRFQRMVQRKNQVNIIT